MKVVGFVFGAALCCLARAADDEWMPNFYQGLETVGTVQRVEKAYKGEIDAIRLVWKSGAMKFGVKKAVTTELTGFVDWTVEALVKSEGDYGYAGAAMEFFDARGGSLGIVWETKPIVAKDWRKITWRFSAPKDARRQEVHLLSLEREPVQFCRIKVTSRQGVDKGDIPFEVMALPSEWNRDWNGGENRMMNFSDAPIPVSFHVKGSRKGREGVQFVLDAPAELEIKDAYCPNADAYEALKPSAVPFALDGVAYVRYVFENAKIFAKMDVAKYDFDKGVAIAVILGPKGDGTKVGKKFRLFYRMMQNGRRGEEKAMEMVFRPLPVGLRQTKDFKVFSWNNCDRHFASDAAATNAFRAYEAAGLVSFRKTDHTPWTFPRLKELTALLEKRPVRYTFSSRLGDPWRPWECGVDAAKMKTLGVRMSVTTDKNFPYAKGWMCPEYFIHDPRIREQVRTHVRDVLSQCGVTDGDWVTFDMEPFRSTTWCHCDECHKAFAAFAGLDHVPTVDEIRSPALVDRWADFRCMHNEKSVELLTRFIREYNPTLKCVDYDYVMPYGNEEGMKARRRECAKDTRLNEKWLDGHLCSYYHKIDLESFKAMRNDMRHLKCFYVPMGAISGAGVYLNQGEVLCPRQVRQFALAALVNGCRGYAFYSGVCYDGEMLLAMMEAGDVAARYEDLPWGKVDGKIVPTNDDKRFAYASTVRPDGTEVLALFNYEPESSVRVDVAGTCHELKPYETKFVELGK